MPLTFANPMGLLALLGVPAILAIHFLQRRTRVIPVSTLFLIEQRRDQSRLGRRFDRLISSVPMWLQILMVLLLAAFLAQPSLPLPGSVQRVAIVLDASASMRVCKPELKRQLAALTDRCRKLARRTEFLVLPDDPTQPRLYAGESPADLLSAISQWQPVGGPVDPAGSLRLARERVGNRGVVVFATDTPQEKLPADALLLAVGRPIANVGITGLTLTQRDGHTTWQALVANHGTSPQQRPWHLEWDQGQHSPEAILSLPPGGMERLSGTLPAGAKRLRLVLQADQFSLDDTYEFLPAAPKPLLLRQQLPEPLKWLPQRLIRSVPNLETATAGSPPDLVLAAASDGRFPTLSSPAILMSAAGDAAAKALTQPMVAARHPLVSGLLWEPLAIQDVPMLPAMPDDVVLVWCGNQPVVSLRPLPASPCHQLILHFNPAFSNWERLPAAAVLMLRYCENVRQAKRGTTAAQLEPNQSLAPILPPDVRTDLNMETLDITGRTTATRTLAATGLLASRAPATPGFLRVREGDATLIDGAVAFAEAREGDFAACATHDDTTRLVPANDAGDTLGPWWPLVLLTVLAALLTAWAYTGREARTQSTT